MKTRESNREMEQDTNQQNLNTSQKGTKQNTSVDMDELQRESEQQNLRKPGSQSNSSKQHNNGRGGGK